MFAYLILFDHLAQIFDLSRSIVFARIRHPSTTAPPLCTSFHQVTYVSAVRELVTICEESIIPIRFISPAESRPAVSLVEFLISSMLQVLTPCVLRLLAFVDHRLISMIAAFIEVFDLIMELQSAQRQ